ncbi:MAG: hypothetical protein MJ199_00985 [Bacilli bacterium]|nr:hypothetical protein [Bacilli bacterium]
MSRKRFSLDKFPELLKNPPHDIDIMLYDKKKKGSTHHPGDNTVKKPTLSQRMDQLDGRIDRIEESIAKLAEEMRNGFKQVNTRIDRIDTRLDYNGLKRLPVDGK